MKLRPRRRRRLSIGSNVPLHGIPIRDQRRAQLHRRAVSQHEIALPQVLWQQVFVVVHYSTQRNRVFRRAVARNYHLFSSSSSRGFLPPQQFISRCIVRGAVEDITQEFLGVAPQLSEGEPLDANVVAALLGGTWVRVNEEERYNITISPIGCSPPYTSRGMTYTRCER